MAKVSHNLYVPCAEHRDQGGDRSPMLYFLGDEGGGGKVGEAAWTTEAIGVVQAGVCVEQNYEELRHLPSPFKWPAHPTIA